LGSEVVKVGGEPTITALDVALFLEKLYNGKVVSEEASKKMITVMIDQKKNERIPKYLPTGTKVAHKTGELDGVAHDAGIVFSQAGDYIIVLLSDSDNPSGAMEKEALVSKATYEYFSSQPAVDGEK
jgi:beta-lactamase class A